MTGILVAAAATGAPTSPTPDGTVIFSHTMAGAWTFTIPSGVSFVWIEGWGGGGAGSEVFSGGGGGGKGGGGGGGNAASYGGGGAGYFKTHVAVSAGNVVGGIIGAPGTFSGTTATATTLNANSGISLAAATANPGGNATPGVMAGTAGTASGGSVTNASGHAGGLTNYWDGGGSGPSPSDVTIIGAVAQTPGGGSPGGAPPQTGGVAQITITAKSS